MPTVMLVDGVQETEIATRQASLRKWMIGRFSLSGPEERERRERTLAGGAGGLVRAAAAGAASPERQEASGS